MVSIIAIILMISAILASCFGAVIAIATGFAALLFSDSPAPSPPWFQAWKTILFIQLLIVPPAAFIGAMIFGQLGNKASIIFSSLVLFNSISFVMLSRHDYLIGILKRLF